MIHAVETTQAPEESSGNQPVSDHDDIITGSLMSLCLMNRRGGGSLVKLRDLNHLFWLFPKRKKSVLHNSEEKIRIVKPGTHLLMWHHAVLFCFHHVLKMWKSSSSPSSSWRFTLTLCDLLSAVVRMEKIVCLLFVAVRSLCCDRKLWGWKEKRGRGSEKLWGQNWQTSVGKPQKVSSLGNKNNTSIITSVACSLCFCYLSAQFLFLQQRPAVY